MTQYHVTINAQGYVLDLDRYTRRLREPFVPRQGQGSVAVGDLRGPEQLFVISDWSGGEGYVQHDPTPPGRYRTASGLDGASRPGALQLGPSVSVVQATSENSLGPLQAYSGKLYAGSSGTNLYSWDGSTWSSVAFGAPIAALEVFLNRLYVGHTAGGSMYRWDGSAFTLAATAGASIYTLRTHYREAAQYLYLGASGAGVNGVGRLYYYDGASLSLGQFDPEEPRPITAFVLGDLCYIVAADTTIGRWSLYSVDRSGSGGQWRRHAEVKGGGSVLGSAVVGDTAYLGDSAGQIWAWDGSDLHLLRAVSGAGALQALASWRGALWVGIMDGGAISLLRYDPSAGSASAPSAGSDQAAGWSRPVAGLVGSGAASLGVFGDDLYVGTAQSGAARLYRVRAGLYGASGTLESGLVDCGLPGVPKLLRSVTLVTSALVSPQSVQVEYRLEDTGAWTSLGTLSTVGATTVTYSFPAQTTCRQAALRLTLSGTAGASSSPIVYELAVRYVPRPTITREWELAVVLEGTPELPLVTLDGAPESLTGAQLTSALWAAAGASGPVTLVDLDGSSYSVYVQDVREEVGKISQRKGYQRLGLVKLVEAA